MESRAQYYNRKHICRFCGYKSHMIIHMHERYCEHNPKHSINIARCYGPRHLTGDMIGKIIRYASTVKESVTTGPKSFKRGQNTRANQQPQTATVGVQVPDLTDFQSDNLLEADSVLNTLDISDLALNGPLPELTCDDFCAMLSSL